MVSMQAGALIAREQVALPQRTGRVRTLTLEGAAWDACLEELDGQIQQSWVWGEWKRRHDRQVERFVVDGDAGTAMAQVLFKHQGPMSTAFVSRGPLVRGDAESVLPPLWHQIELACRRHRTITLNVEPEHSIPVRTIEGWEPAFGSRRFTPLRTVMIPLSDDATLVQQMHKSKRRELRRAQRDGIEVEVGTPSGGAMDAFHTLLVDTAERNRIRINPQTYYADFLRLHGDNATLMLAVADGKVAAGLIASRFGDTGTYTFGGSSTANRVSGATAMLQYTAMRWARDSGCRQYDLWGIPDEDPPTYVDAAGNPVRSVGDSDAGLYRFKVEFGGEIIKYPPSFEIRYRPGAAWAMRRLKDLEHALRA